MTLEQLQTSPMITEAMSIRDVALSAQIGVNVMTKHAEMQALQIIEGRLGDSGDVPESPELSELVDVRIKDKVPVISPRLLEEALPTAQNSLVTTSLARSAIGDILVGESKRLIVITGPCSIHSAEEALDYAGHLNEWRNYYGDDLEIIMRSYFEKPRTEKDWKGLIYDPLLDGSYDLNLGLTLARITALRITELGVPIAMERLNALTPQYFNGLVAYDAIGARTTEDQKAREYASGTSSPIGFKNSTDGNMQAAISAIVAANGEHTFLGTTMSGMSAEINTTGNDLAHLILRGGRVPNYAPRFIQRAGELLGSRSLLMAVVVDASHGNSGKIAANQFRVVSSLARQMRGGNYLIKGVMLESNLEAGQQKQTNILAGAEMRKGVSITDECINLQDTTVALDALARAVSRRRTILAAN